MTRPHDIRKASPEEAYFLSGLAMRSKAHWGYSQEFLDSCGDELTVDPARIATDDDYDCFVAVDGDVILGFYAMEAIAKDVCELESLFVEPKHIGTGIGRSLIKHALRELHERGAARLIIQSDPNAGHFYIAAGARNIGTRESDSIPGRYLPLFEIEIGKS